MLFLNKNWHRLLKVKHNLERKRGRQQRDWFILPLDPPIPTQDRDKIRASVAIVDDERSKDKPNYRLNDFFPCLSPLKGWYWIDWRPGTCIVLKVIIARRGISPTVLLPLEVVTTGEVPLVASLPHVAATHRRTPWHFLFSYTKEQAQSIKKTESERIMRSKKPHQQSWRLQQPK